MSGKEIHDDMIAELGDSAPSYTAVKNWVAEFKRGRNTMLSMSTIQEAPRTQHVPITSILLMICYKKTDV